MTLPTVGRAVHFYDTSLAGTGANNAQNEGPYHAIVGQVFPSGMANLRVSRPFGDDKWEGSVLMAHPESRVGRFWEWPPGTAEANALLRQRGG